MKRTEICTETCLATCPVVGPLGSAGATLAQTQELIRVAAAELPAACGSGQPVAMQSTEGLRCDLHPEVASRVAAVADLLVAGAIKLA